MSGDTNKSIRYLIENLIRNAKHKEDLAMRYIKEESFNASELFKQLWEAYILQEFATEIEEAIDSKGDPKKEIQDIIDILNKHDECKEKMLEHYEKIGISPDEETIIRTEWQSEMATACAEYLEEIINKYYDNQESEE